MQDFINYGITVAEQVGILFIMVFAGVFISKKKMINKEGVDQMVNVLLYLVAPCIIVYSFLDIQANRENIQNLLMSLLCAFCLTVFGIIAAFIFKKTKPKERRAVLRVGVIFSNSGFISLPIAFALLGSEGVFLASMFVVMLNISQWTYGVSLFGSEEKMQLSKIFLNPGTIGVMIGLPLFLLSYLYKDFSLPTIVIEPVNVISKINTPLAMLITGFFLYNSNMKTGLKDKPMWLSITLRLITVPIISLLLFKFVFNLNDTLLIAAMIPTCAPSAVTTVIFATKFGGDTDLASRLLSVCTLCSIVTLPVFLSLAKL